MRKLLLTVTVTAMLALAGTSVGAGEERPYEPDAQTALLLHLDTVADGLTPDAAAPDEPVRLLPAPRTPVVVEDGFFGRCLRFDGVNADEDGDGRGDADGLVLRDSGRLRPGDGLTVEAWVLPERVDRNQAIVSRSGAARYCLFLYGPAIYFSMQLERNGELQWARVRAEGVMQAGHWQHVAVTWDGSELHAWLDGVEVASAPAEGTPSTGDATTMIGCDTDSRPLDEAIRGFQGLIDEVRISTVAREEFNVSPQRTAARLAQLQAPRPPDEDPRAPFPDPPLPPLQARHVVVTGHVADDAGNALAGVMVSDGEHVTRTDASGAYRLEFDLDELRHVFVTVPRGYRAAAPWYLAIPRNEAKTRYAGDFVLTADPLTDRERFSFLATGDTQFADLALADSLRAEFAHFTAMSGDPAFVTVAGDLTMSGTQWQMERYLEIMAASHLPVRNCFGGHDGNYGREAGGEPSVYHYLANLGPAWYSWDYGPVHFLTYVTETGYLSEAQRARQERWLEADLSAQPPGTPIVIVTHYTPPDAVMSAWRERFNIIGVMFGHWHRVQSCGFAGVPYLETGPMRGADWGAFTRRFRVVEYADGALSSEVRVCGQVRRVDIVAPRGEVARGVVPVEVKAYDTTRRVAEVRCEIAAGADTIEVPLERAGAWTWCGRLDTRDLPEGALTVRATVTDETGERWEASAEAELGAAALPQVRIGEDWPGFFREGHSRVHPAALPAPLQLVWAVNTGGRNQGPVTPIIYDGRLYVGVDHREIGHPGAGVRCYDPASGALLWEAPTGASVAFGLAAGDGRVHAIDTMGVCYAFDAETGAERWRTEVFPPVNGRRTVASCPVLADGELIVMSDDADCAVLDPATGQVLRRVQVASGLTYCSFPSVHAGRIFAGYRRTATATDLRTGERMWTTEISTGKAASCPVPAGDALYVNAATLTCLDEATGEVRWRQGVPTSGNGISVAVPAGDIVLANGAALRAFDAATGELRWEHPHVFDEPDAGSSQRQAMAGQSTPLVTGDTVYVASDAGHLCAIGLADGALRWSYDLGVPIKGSPVVSGNALYITDWDGNLYCFAARE